MADATLSAQTALISGVAPDAVAAASYATADTITVYGPPGGELDFNSLSIRIAASGGTVTAAFVASDEFSGEDLGNYAFSVSSATTAIFGGTNFEGSRFKHTGTSGTAYCQILVAATSGIAIEAIQAPYSVTG